MLVNEDRISIRVQKGNAGGIGGILGDFGLQRDAFPWNWRSSLRMAVNVARLRVLLSQPGLKLADMLRVENLEFVG